jgi:hypothetical protein
MSARDAVALSSACALPPFASPPGKHARANGDGKAQSHLPKMLDNSNVQLAPYQALPVGGPLITHHRAAALNVLEPGTMPEDVSLAVERRECRCVRAGGRARARAAAISLCAARKKWSTSSLVFCFSARTHNTNRSARRPSRRPSPST